MPRYILIALVLLSLMAGCRQGETASPSSAPEADPSQSLTEPQADSALPEESSPQEESDPPEPDEPAASTPIMQPEPSSDPQAAQSGSEAPSEPETPSTSRADPPSASRRQSQEGGAASRSSPPEDTPLPTDNEAAGPTREDAVSPFRAQDFALAPAAGSTSRVEEELLELINAARAELGLTALGVEESMQFAAAIRAEEVLESLSHTRPDGTAYHTAFDEAGFSYAGKWHGENLAFLYLQGEELDDDAIARALFAEWSKSPGHERNMLSENFVQTGISVFVLQDDTGLHIGSAQLFAGL